MKLIQGFSKLSKDQKINFIEKFTGKSKLRDFFFFDNDLQKKFDDFSENTISNFHIPYGVVPNFLIDGKSYIVPMATEESSVVAAAAKSAKFWALHGGFSTKLESVVKVGHIYFEAQKSEVEFRAFFTKFEKEALSSVNELSFNMQQRGGGIHSLTYNGLVENMPSAHKVELKVKTCDAMGANFINSLLEKIAKSFRHFYEMEFKEDLEIIMAILSNNTPECIAEASVELPVREFKDPEFARKFCTAVDIANNDVDRAVTHNKGIMNGVDSLVIASGNDFRAIEAACHAFAARSGTYRSLSSAQIVDGVFHFSIRLPLSLGTVGGLTVLHPLAKFTLNLLGNPGAEQLMRIVACVGLAQNYSAVNSLVTTGIQKGHMKMHLLNILNQKDVSEAVKQQAIEYFKDKVVSFREVENFLGKTAP